MKESLLILVCLFVSGSLHAEVNGSIEYIGDVRVLNLWGSWSEMGYAHGYLMGPNIKLVFHDYFMELVGSVSNYNMIRTYFLNYFEVPPEFEAYSQGIILGASDTISIFSDTLGREIDYIDVCVISATPDLSALGGVKLFLCSSTSAWNSATEYDPVLSGSPAVSRNLDYYVDTDGSILENNLLITLDPQIGQNWISIGFPGFMGCLSGMNESGISAFLNMGSNSGTSQYTSPFVPICMAQALGLSNDDFNGSGSCDVQDMKDALTGWNRSNSYDIHVIANRTLAGQDSSSVVVEVNNRDGYAFRYASDEPAISPCRMILTNHHRVLIPPEPCYRYDYLMDSLTANPDVTLGRLWNFMGAVGWPAIPGYGGTIQTMVFMPEQLKLRLAFSTVSTPSYNQNPEWIEWTDIFPNHSPQGIEEDAHREQSIQITPNPSSGIVTIYYPGNINDISIYDTAGRKMELSFVQQDNSRASVDLSSLPGGIYRISVRIDSGSLSENIVIIP